MPVLIKSFYPTIARLDWELTTIALGLEHGLPVFFAVVLSIFNMEASRTDSYSALRAGETLRTEGCVQSIHTFPHDLFRTFVALRSKVLLVVLLTEQLTIFLNKTNSNQRTLTVRV